jgi:hypothetical protein
MKAIIQHNFNTGWGDGLFAITDYLNNTIELKKLGYEVELRFNIRTNLYFKSKKPLDYLEEEIFSIFDKISINSDFLYLDEQDGFSCVFTFANAKPGQHFYDIFVESSSKQFYSDNMKVCHFNMINMINGNLPNVYPILNSEIQKKFEDFIRINDLVDYDSIYFRTQDLQEELEFLDSNKKTINEILSDNKKLFICSNSKEFKNYVKSLKNPNVYFWEIPLEDEWGGNHLLHQRIDDDILHERNIYTFLDMWTLSKSKKIHFFTTWGRYSNFLFYAPINGSQIIYK